MAKIIYDPEAKQEIKEAAAYSEECQEGLGQRFLSAVELTVEKVSNNPFLYRKFHGRFRRCLVNKFPYGIIYTIGENDVFIAAVMHLKRKPGYWIKRVEDK
jgi:toxin ParE1/3/4